MSPIIGLPLPEPESCLVYSRASRYKGGSLVREEVHDLESHQRRVSSPDGYRPSACPRCGHTILHVHSYRERKPRREVGVPAEIRIVQYLCARKDCGAIWRVLPMFLARHLWWAWKAVEHAVLPTKPQNSKDASAIPEQTRRRWRARIASSARILVALLAARGDSDVQRFARSMSADTTRAALVEAFADSLQVADGERLASVAALSHRLERGVRLM